MVKHSAGTRLWDLDNNEYLDVTLGFGTHFFGHSPDFAVRAQQWQLHKGVEVGPQSPLVGKVAELMCELTGMERAAFCNTGSEAVLAAIRLARTVTGRVKIATMSGAYHGINDEVLVRGTMVDGQPKTMPIAPGIPQHAVSEVLVLEYGSPAALEILRAHAHELAAVLVEPVQSRQPDLAPVEFLREVRKITEESETALIFDELVTGFRVHPGGCQALWGIRADMATYGKVIGGGMPIGALCGKAMYLDALDGGNWQYGDASFPEVGVTFFAGTFVRHQLAVRSTLSVLTYLKRQGPALQERVTQLATTLVDTLNTFFEEARVPMRMTRFASMMYFRFQDEFKYSSLLFYHLRLRGIHIWEARPVFLSTVHTEEDVAILIHAFKESIEALRAGGFLPEAEASATVIPAKPAALPAPVVEAPAKPMQFSLYFFGNYDAAYRDDKYSAADGSGKICGCERLHRDLAAGAPFSTPSAVSPQTPRSWPARWRGRRRSSNCAVAVWFCRCIIQSAWRRSGPSSTISRRDASASPSRRAGIPTISFSRLRTLRTAATSTCSTWKPSSGSGAARRSTCPPPTARR